MDKHKPRALALASVLVLALVGCSSAEDKVYKAFYCGKVASMLGNDAAADRALAKVAVEMEKLTTTYSPSRISMVFSERFQEDVPLYRYGDLTQRKVLADIYGSSQCKKYYQ